MSKLFINTRDELICIDTDLIALVQASGNYSRLIYITKKETILTVGITKLESALLACHGQKSRFIRLGRSYIINHYYLSKVDVLKQCVILSDNDKNDIKIQISKKILKSYKNSVVKIINENALDTAIDSHIFSL